MTELIAEFNMTSKDARPYCEARTLDELSSEFNLDREHIKKICTRYGLYWKRVYRKKEKPFPREAMIKCLAKEFTYDQVGLVFGVSRQRIEQIVNS